VIAFLLKRLVWMVITLWVVYTITFFLMRFVPGGPFDGERKLSAAAQQNIEAQYRLDLPLHEQYLYHLGKAVRFDFGRCLKLPDNTVNQVIAEGFPVSASLGIFAMVFAIVVGMTAGIVSSLRRNTWVDYLLMGFATIGIAVPNFVLAGICIMLFVFYWQIFPAAGWGTPEQMILPALCLGAPFAAYIARLSRTGLLEVLGQDYIRTAYAKGLLPRRVVMGHAMRGAIVPVVSYLGPATAGILTGSLVLEQIFGLTGLGTHFIEAVNGRDYAVAAGITLVYTVVLFVANTIVDVLYSLLDPRVTLQ
jgi:ABC-type dipeptide/oligopeptide/nickel transport system permease component